MKSSIRTLLTQLSKCHYSSGKTLSNRPILPNKQEYNPSSISQFFVDHKVVKLKGGNGGDGMVSFLHTKEKEFGGPDGGDGGNGAHIIFESSEHLKSLNRIQSQYQAENGENGRAYNMKGKSGKHLVIRVPNGTVFKNASTNDEIVTLDNMGIKKFIAARGGAGGKGNHYYLANDNRKPIQFEYGHKGEQVVLFLELNLIADAALIGLPNAGKSSLLDALTRARPKIGAYSFTTLYPHVGIVEYEDFTQIALADFPGLLPDLTSGLGSKYLHHLENCRLLLVVVDISAENACEQYEAFCEALNSYNSQILKSKPVIVIANKVDNLSKEEISSVLDKLKARTNRVVVPISTVKKINLSKLLVLMRDMYDETIETDA